MFWVNGWNWWSFNKDVGRGVMVIFVESPEWRIYLIITIDRKVNVGELIIQLQCRHNKTEKPDYLGCRRLAYFDSSQYYFQVLKACLKRNYLRNDAESWQIIFVKIWLNVFSEIVQYPKIIQGLMINAKDQTVFSRYSVYANFGVCF